MPGLGTFRTNLIIVIKFIDGIAALRKNENNSQIRKPAFAMETIKTKPVTMITGYLGSGKTTVLNELRDLNLIKHFNRHCVYLLFREAIKSYHQSFVFKKPHSLA